MRRPVSGRTRVLTPEEAAHWAALASTVTPLVKRRVKPVAAPVAPLAALPAAKITPPKFAKPARVIPPPPALPPPPAKPRALDAHGLDGGWDRRLASGAVSPDFTLDLHGAGLDAAYVRLEHGLALALQQGARVVLLVTGRARPAPGPADRGHTRGAIRAKLLDWLAHGSHASRIAAVRGAHPRHGGAGAVYIVLKRAKTP